MNSRSNGYLFASTGVKSEPALANCVFMLEYRLNSEHVPAMAKYPYHLVFCWSNVAMPWR
jgi:hypothetical protein